MSCHTGPRAQDHPHPLGPRSPRTYTQDLHPGPRSRRTTHIPGTQVTQDPGHLGPTPRTQVTQDDPHPWDALPQPLPRAPPAPLIACAPALPAELTAHRFHACFPLSRSHGDILNVHLTCFRRNHRETSCTYISPNSFQPDLRNTSPACTTIPLPIFSFRTSILPITGCSLAPIATDVPLQLRLGDSKRHTGANRCTLIATPCRTQG